MNHNFDADLAHHPPSTRIDMSLHRRAGPKDRTMKLLAALRAEGQDTDRENFYAPVGLDIGATTPEGIALAIIARDPGRTRRPEGRIAQEIDRGPIYDR
jgi:hypothetical protein